MSNLQILANRCPVMGKAMAVQASKSFKAPFRVPYTAARSFGEYRGKARLHTSGVQAATVDTAMVQETVNGMTIEPLLEISG